MSGENRGKTKFWENFSEFWSFDVMEYCHVFSKEQSHLVTLVFLHVEK